MSDLTETVAEIAEEASQLVADISADYAKVPVLGFSTREDAIRAGVIALGVGAVAALAGWQLSKRKVWRDILAEVEAEEELQKIDMDEINDLVQTYSGSEVIDVASVASVVEDDDLDDGDVKIMSPIVESRMRQTEEDEQDADISELPVWDMDYELQTRSPDRPYVISDDEFNENIWDFEQRDIYWYEGDGTLADAHGEDIPAISKVVGDANLARFGHGSGDPEVVYICNEEMEMLFEVLRTSQSYKEVVLGFER